MAIPVFWIRIHVMKYLIIPVTPFEQNCTLIWCEKTRKAAVIDPGGDLGKGMQAVEREGLTLEKILLTHAHIDHAGAAGQAGRKDARPNRRSQQPGQLLYQRSPPA